MEKSQNVYIQKKADIPSKKPKIWLFAGIKITIIEKTHIIAPANKLPVSRKLNQILPIIKDRRKQTTPTPIKWKSLAI